MKGNIKKMALLVIITIIALFIIAGTVSAEGSFPNPIKGEYAATGTGSCIIAPFGFTNFIPTPAPDGKVPWALGISIYDAVYTFDGDGTGLMSGTIRSIDQPSPLSGPVPMGWTADWTYKFTYSVTKEGFITFTAIPRTHKVVRTGIGTVTFDVVPSHGVISGDGKAITISCGPPALLKLIDGTTGESLGPQQVCVSSLVLLKLQ